jgi:hypothetical protein
MSDPSEIHALDLKRKFRRSAICPISAAIGINWPIREDFRQNPRIALTGEGPSTSYSPHRRLSTPFAQTCDQSIGARPMTAIWPSAAGMIKQTYG